jgi:hypothetical protein
MQETLRIFSKETFTRKELFYIKKNVSRENFANWLKSEYTVLRCYHASRPTDIASYHSNGLKPCDINKSVEYFESILREINYKGKVDIQETVDLFNGRSTRFIYLILDKYDFIDLAPHYWIYGSEFMLCLAQNTAYHIKDYLRKTGIPTIFTCDVPLSTVDPTELVGLYDRIKGATGTFVQMLNDVFSNYTIIIENHVAGNCITTHEHPTERVTDQHAGGYYKNDISSCPACVVQK